MRAVKRPENRRRQSWQFLWSFCSGNTWCTYFLVQTHFPTLWSLAVDNHRFSAKSAITIICRSYLQFTVVVFVECHRLVSGWKRQREANQCLFYKISARSSLNSRQWLFTFDCPFLHVKKKRKRVKESMRKKEWREHDGTNCCRGAAEWCAGCVILESSLIARPRGEN